jgi:hypothetical protein
LVKAGKDSEVTHLDDLVAGGKDISVKTTPDNYLK